MQQQMQEKMTSVAAASAAVRLNLHNRKSKVPQYNTACNNPITIDVETLEDVETFTYLVSIINEHGVSDANMKTRIGNARTAYLQLKNICNSKQLSVKQHQTQNFQYNCQNSYSVLDGNVENYDSHHPEGTSVY
ncbi:unnamed protein product [Schistosoma mattheei]|uniref:Uncharacterized protein n=1 Tax=Schistosoma mattheei TaxID=31246 RepID=A0A183NGC3_9TREM|nr:unnamed protein product [Schistosoma mattheei]